MQAEFWRLATVKQRVGLSKTEIYRRIERGEFPRSRAYPGSRLVYWLSDEIAAWQHQVVGDPFAELFG